jgi:hypothetical protein
MHDKETFFGLKNRIVLYIRCLSIKTLEELIYNDEKELQFIVGGKKYLYVGIKGYMQEGFS